MFLGVVRITQHICQRLTIQIDFIFGCLVRPNWVETYSSGWSHMSEAYLRYQFKKKTCWFKAYVRSCGSLNLSRYSETIAQLILFYNTMLAATAVVVVTATSAETADAFSCCLFSLPMHIFLEKKGECSARRHTSTVPLPSYARCAH